MSPSENMLLIEWHSQQRSKHFTPVILHLTTSPAPALRAACIATAAKINRLGESIEEVAAVGGGGRSSWHVPLKGGATVAAHRLIVCSAGRCESEIFRHVETGADGLQWPKPFHQLHQLHGSVLLRACTRTLPRKMRAPLSGPSSPCYFWFEFIFTCEQAGASARSVACFPVTARQLSNASRRHISFARQCRRKTATRVSPRARNNARVLAYPPGDGNDASFGPAPPPTAECRDKRRLSTRAWGDWRRLPPDVVAHLPRH